jgi:hypothetical protein
MNKLFDFFAMLLWDKDAGGGDGGAGGGNGDQGSGNGGGDQSLAARAAAAVAESGKEGAAAAAANGTPYYPEGLGEAFRGKDNNETIDKLFGHVNGLPKAPAKPEDYQLALSEDFTTKFGDLKDDKVVGVWRGVAHELGLPDAAFSGVIEKLYGALEKEGMLDVGPDPDAELAKLMPREGDDKSRQLAAYKRIDDSASWIKGLVAKGLPKDGAIMLSGLLENAAGVQVLEFLSRNIPGMQAGGGGPSTPTKVGDRSLEVMYPSHFKT